MVNPIVATKQTNQNEFSTQNAQDQSTEMAASSLKNAGITIEFVPVQAPALIQGGGGNGKLPAIKAQAREQLWTKAA